MDYLAGDGSLLWIECIRAGLDPACMTPIPLAGPEYRVFIVISLTRRLASVKLSRPTDDDR